MKNYLSMMTKKPETEVVGNISPFSGLKIRKRLLTKTVLRDWFIDESMKYSLFAMANSRLICGSLSIISPNIIQLTLHSEQGLKDQEQRVQTLGNQIETIVEFDLIRRMILSPNLHTFKFDCTEMLFYAHSDNQKTR